MAWVLMAQDTGGISSQEQGVKGPRIWPINKKRDVEPYTKLTGVKPCTEATDVEPCTKVISGTDWAP